MDDTDRIVITMTNQTDRLLRQISSSTLIVAALLIVIVIVLLAAR